ncbi:MAG: amidase [Actinomycetota bacterium]
MRQSALELARLVREGEVTSRELVEASLERIEATEPLNHWTLLDSEAALATAEGIGKGDERPFAGVPLAIKDLFAPVAGLRMAQGSDLLGDFTPDYDYALVRRFREAGFVLVGKTQTPEFGILPVTEPRRFGPARNPWDPERTTGGSSGGSAGAVAAGAVPVAHGSDGGGSIRIPAACCGLVGLKPHRGRISRAPDLGDQMLSTDGALTRTTADAAALLDVMAGYEVGDATWAAPPEAPFAELARRDPGRLRVALTFDMPIDSELDPECERGAREAAAALEALGHDVEEVDAPWKGADLLPTFSVLWAANVSASVFHGQIVTGNEPTDENIEPLSKWLWETGKGTSAPEYIGAVATLQAFARGLVAFWEGYDLVLTPGLAKRPVRHGEIDPCGENPAYEFKKSGQFTPYTAPFNVTGQPAISVPIAHGDDGLPTAAQLVGPPLGEGLLLQVAGQLEQARPWADRVPPEPA